MANWTHKLELKDLHDKFDTEEMTVEQIGKEVAKRLRALVEKNSPPIPKGLREDAEDIALTFETDVQDISDYDRVLEDLYDWADTPLRTPPGTPFCQERKLCWINTF